MTTAELIGVPLPLATIPINVTREIIITDEQTLLVVEIIVYFPSVTEVGISNANFQGRERLLKDWCNAIFLNLHHPFFFQAQLS